jgi:DNA-binding response OmpR family regulator
MSIAHKRKILVVDDDAQVLRDVKRYMETQGYEVGVAGDGLSAVALVDTMSPDLVVLDIAFPVENHLKKQTVDGIEVLRRVRESSGVPVVMLSSTNVSAVKVMALKIGADDYLAKPFDMQELGARIDAVLRRTTEDRADDKILNLRRLRLDPGERRVWKDDEPVELTAVEFNLLYALARRPGHVFTREKLLQLAWGDLTYSIPKVVDVHIGHIRRKIENNPSDPTLIITVRGIGYRLADEAA